MTIHRRLSHVTATTTKSWKSRSENWNRRPQSKKHKFWPRFIDEDGAYRNQWQADYAKLPCSNGGEGGEIPLKLMEKEMASLIRKTHHETKETRRPARTECIYAWPTAQLRLGDIRKRLDGQGPRGSGMVDRIWHGTGQ